MTMESLLDIASDSDMGDQHGFFKGRVVNDKNHRKISQEACCQETIRETGCEAPGRGKGGSEDGAEARREGR